jgi:uncharacterized membrane protein YraQ (UPF0718 family)
MNILVGTVLLWALGLWLYRRVGLQGAEVQAEIRAEAIALFGFLLPRIFVGIVGAGFMAELLPADRMEALFGDGAGLTGVLLATLAGLLTPSGPFIAFAVAATALQAGAGLGAMLAYLTAWSVLCLNRAFAFELPVMGRRFVLVRSLVSAPMPILLGLIGLAL